MDIDAEREAFEAECEKLGLTIYAGSDCRYAPEIQCAWMLWQAQAAMPLVIPEGYALVPIEPTKAMIDAALRDDYDEHDPRSIVYADYRAMVAEAQQATK